MLTRNNKTNTTLEQSKDVTAWYRKRYQGVVAAERLGGEVLVLFDEGED